jgi:DNA-binding CsgD family transcriptional regulator
LATRSTPRKDLTRTNRPAASQKRAQAPISDLLLLEELHANLPVGLLVNDADTLEVLHAKLPLPGLAVRDLPREQLPRTRQQDVDDSPLGPELASLVREVAATGTPQHLPEFRHEPPEREPRWWSASLHRVDTDRWGQVVVTLAVDLTDQVRARRLLAEREARHETLRQAIAAVPGRNLVLSLQQVTDALVPALPIDVATLRLLDADANLHLVAASGLRPAETRRLALTPITAQRLETMIDPNRLSLLAALGLHCVEVRWLEGRAGRIGIVTIGARSKHRLSDEDRALLDAAAAQLSSALERLERSSRSIRSRALETARLSAAQAEAAQIQANNLRPREQAILRLYREGLRTDQIAELLVLSPHTVRTHVRNARRRLGVNSRNEALELLAATDADPAL